MTTILTPEQVQAKNGRLFCRQLITMVDEENGMVRIVEKCMSGGPMEWDAVNRRRAGGIVRSIVLRNGMMVTDADIGEREISFGPASKRMGASGIRSVRIEGDEVRTTWFGMAGSTVGIGACMPACPDVIRTEYPDDFRMGGAHITHVDIITPKMVRVIIGIDDTDTKDEGATWVVGLKLANECPIGKFVEHKIIQLNPEAPNKTTNCCSTAVSFAVRESEVDALVAYAEDFVRKESFSDDAVMSVYKGLSIPEGLRDFGWSCKSVLYKPEDAMEMADRYGVRVIPLTGGNGGVIGAVAAIGCFEFGEKASGIPEDFEDGGQFCQ